MRLTRSQEEVLRDLQKLTGGGTLMSLGVRYPFVVENFLLQKKLVCVRELKTCEGQPAFFLEITDKGKAALACLDSKHQCP